MKADLYAALGFRFTGREDYEEILNSLRSHTRPGWEEEIPGDYGMPGVATVGCVTDESGARILMGETTTGTGIAYPIPVGVTAPVHADAICRITAFVAEVTMTTGANSLTLAVRLDDAWTVPIRDSLGYANPISDDIKLSLLPITVKISPETASETFVPEFVAPQLSTITPEQDAVPLCLGSVQLDTVETQTNTLTGEKFHRCTVSAPIPLTVYLPTGIGDLHPGAIITGTFLAQGSTGFWDN